MNFILNLIIAIIVGFLADAIMARCGVTDPVKVLLAVLLGILVFFMNIAVSIH